MYIYIRPKMYGQTVLTVLALAFEQNNCASPQRDLTSHH
jgi:hypothetical protein